MAEQVEACVDGTTLLKVIRTDGDVVASDARVATDFEHTFSLSLSLDALEVRHEIERASEVPVFAYSNIAFYLARPSWQSRCSK